MRTVHRTRQEPAPRVGTQAEAAEQLGVTERTIRRYVSEGRIRAYRVGPRLVRVNLDDVDAMLSPITTFDGDSVAS